MSEFIKVTKVKSTIAEQPRIRKVVSGLGLKRIGSYRVHKDNNCIRGMINKVKHIVEYEFVKK